MSLATRLFNSTRSNEYAINPPASTNSENGYIAGSFAAPIRFAMREWFAKTEGHLKILRAIADLDMFWVEIDSFNPEALGYIRRQSPHPVSSCETLLGLREFLPYFREQAMDVAIIDTPWNGVWQSMKIASAAEACEVNVAPHNFYGHLCTVMNAHFSAAVPNLRIMETDIDRLPWDHELFTHVPEIENGHLIMPERPGWGTEPNEDALRAHPPKGNVGLLNHVKKPE